MDIGQAEILLAQKLSSGEPRIRRKALYRLDQRINACSAKNSYTRKEDFQKLWKGLYYCFWLQDKPLIQEELSDSITKLLEGIRDVNQKLFFVESFYEEIGKSWPSLDQWRVDKFLMFYRRMFRQILLWLKSSTWDQTKVESVFKIFRLYILNPDSDSYPLGLKLHFISIYMDEVDNAGAGELSKSQVFDFLSPFFAILRHKSTNDVLFDAIIDEIFRMILEYCTHHVLDNDSGEQSTSQPLLEFDLEQIKSALLDIGKSKDFTSRRRRIVYALVKKYSILAEGKDPFYEEISEEDSDLDVEGAVTDLMNDAEKSKKIREKHNSSKMKRKHTKAKVEDSSKSVKKTKKTSSGVLNKKMKKC